MHVQQLKMQFSIYSNVYQLSTSIITYDCGSCKWVSDITSATLKSVLEKHHSD